MCKGDTRHVMKIRLARLTDAEALAFVHVESSRTTYRGMLPEDVLQDFSLDRRTHQWRKMLSDPTSPEVIYVAEVQEGSIVGFASAGPEREGDAVYNGELYAIYLLASAQRQGIGRQLVEAVVNHFLQQGMTTLLVWVLAANPACAFYEALGGKRVHTKTIQRSEKLLQEIAYGWEDIHSFLKC